MSTTSLTKHFQFMAQCLFVAYRALQQNETPVACILVDEKGEVVSVGFNDTNRSLNGTRHAEFIAIDEALRKGSIASLANLTLYVTVEPCIMCAAALKQINIKQVIYGCGNERFGGNGTVLNINTDSYKSYPGILRTEAIQLLRNFYIQENESAPDPQLKKNTDIENKAYPILDFSMYMDEAEFSSFYGEDRMHLYKDLSQQQHNIEITPELNKNYKLRDLITAKDVMSLPQLDYLYSDIPQLSMLQVQTDLEKFFSMFYDVASNGTIDFGKKILTINSNEPKKRKLQDNDI